MGLRRSLTISLLAVAVVGVGGAERASACSCVPLELDRETFRQSDGAVIAKFVERDPVGPLRADYRYRVQRVFRGRRVIERGEVIAIRSAASSAACGLETPLGHREGLFLERRAGRWSGSLCSTAEPRKMRRAAEREGIATTAGCNRR